MSIIAADTIKSRVAGAAVTTTNGLNVGGATTVAGAVVATSFAGDGSSITALSGSNISSGTVAAARVATLNQDTTGTAALAEGLTGTPNITVGNISAAGGDATVRNITGVAATFTGVLTYEDVTNVDSVGIVTARSGIEFGAAGVGGTVSALGHAEFVGIVTAKSDVNVGSAITMYASSGIVSATSYYGDASNMSGMAGGAWEVVSTTAISGSTTELQLYGWSNNYAQYKVVFQDCYNSSDIKMKIRFYTDATSGNNGTLVTSSTYQYVGGYIQWNSTNALTMEAGEQDYFYPYTTASGGSAEVYTGELIFPMKTSGYNDAVKCYGTMLAHNYYWPMISCELQANPTHFLTGIHIYFTESGNTNPLSPSTGRITLLRMKYS